MKAVEERHDYVEESYAVTFKLAKQHHTRTLGLSDAVHRTASGAVIDPKLLPPRAPIFSRIHASDYLIDIYPKSEPVGSVILVIEDPLREIPDPPELETCPPDGTPSECAAIEARNQAALAAHAALVMEIEVENVEIAEANAQKRRDADKEKQDNTDAARAALTLLEAESFDEAGRKAVLTDRYTVALPESIDDSMAYTGAYWTAWSLYRKEWIEKSAASKFDFQFQGEFKLKPEQDPSIQFRIDEELAREKAEWQHKHDADVAKAKHTVNKRGAVKVVVVKAGQDPPAPPAAHVDNNMDLYTAAKEKFDKEALEKAVNEFLADTKTYGGTFIRESKNVDYLKAQEELAYVKSFDGNIRESGRPLSRSLGDVTFAKSSLAQAWAHTRPLSLEHVIANLNQVAVHTLRLSDAYLSSYSDLEDSLSAQNLDVYKNYFSPDQQSIELANYPVNRLNFREAIVELEEIVSHFKFLRWPVMQREFQCNLYAEDSFANSTKASLGADFDQLVGFGEIHKLGGESSRNQTSTFAPGFRGSWKRGLSWGFSAPENENDRAFIGNFSVFDFFTTRGEKSPQLYLITSGSSIDPYDFGTDLDGRDNNQLASRITMKLLPPQFETPYNSVLDATPSLVSLPIEAADPSDEREQWMIIQDEAKERLTSYRYADELVFNAASDLGVPQKCDISISSDRSGSSNFFYINPTRSSPFAPGTFAAMQKESREAGALSRNVEVSGSYFVLAKPQFETELPEQELYPYPEFTQPTVNIETTDGMELALQIPLPKTADYRGISYLELPLLIYGEPAFTHRENTVLVNVKHFWGLLAPVGHWALDNLEFRDPLPITGGELPSDVRNLTPIAKPIAAYRGDSIDLELDWAGHYDVTANYKSKSGELLSKFRIVWELAGARTGDLIPFPEEKHSITVYRDDQLFQRISFQPDYSVELEVLDGNKTIEYTKLLDRWGDSDETEIAVSQGISAATFDSVYAPVALSQHRGSITTNQSQLYPTTTADSSTELTYRPLRKTYGNDAELFTMHSGGGPVSLEGIGYAGSSYVKVPAQYGGQNGPGLAVALESAIVTPKEGVPATITFDPFGAPERIESSFAGMDSVRTFALEGNQLTSDFLLNGTKIATSVTEYSADLDTMVTEEGGIITTTSFYTNGELAGIDGAIKSRTTPSGETEYSYSSRPDGGLTVETTSTSGDRKLSTSRTVEVNQFGELVKADFKVGGTKVSDVTATGHASNAFGKATRITSSQGGVSTTYDYQYDDDGTLTDWSSSDGDVHSYNWDNLGRLASGTNINGTQFSPEFKELESSFTFGEFSSSRKIDAEGKLVKAESNVAGEKNSFRRQAGTGIQFAGRRDNENRGFLVDYLPSGLVSEVGPGLNSPGVDYAYSVESVGSIPCFAVRQTLKKTTGAASSTWSKNYYDGYGKLIRSESPHPNGTGTVATGYSYDFALNKVTITPPFPARPITIDYTSSGLETTVTQAGLQTITETAIALGEATTTTKLNTTTVSEVTSSLTAPRVEIAQRGVSDMTITATPDGNSVTVANDAGSLTSTRNRDGFSQLSGKVAGKDLDLSVARNTQGRATEVSLETSDASTPFVVALDERGRGKSITGPNINADITRTFPLEGERVLMEDSVSGQSDLSITDSTGSLREIDDSESDRIVVTGSPYDGKVSLLHNGDATRSVDFFFGPTLSLTQKAYSDGSNVSLFYEDDGSIEHYQKAGQGQSFSIFPERSSQGRLTGGQRIYNGAVMPANLVSSLSVSPANGALGEFLPGAYLLSERDVDGTQVVHNEQNLAFAHDVPVDTLYTGVLAGYRVKKVIDPNTGQRTKLDLFKDGVLQHSIEAPLVNGQLKTVKSQGFNATYRYNAITGVWEGVDIGQHSVSRQTNPASGRLQGITTTTGGGAYSFSYPSFTGTKRKQMSASIPGVPAVTWNYTYEAGPGALSPQGGQLQSATSSLGHSFQYNHDSYGNRTASLVNGNAALNQYGVFQVAGAREYTVAGRVNPGVAVTVTRGAEDPVVIPVDASGQFSKRFPLPSGFESAQRLPIKVTGRLPGAGQNGTDAVAVETRYISITPSQWQISYGAFGVVESDWRWTYQWDAQERLIGMETQQAAVDAGFPNLKLRFFYDQEGRRIQKKVLHMNAGAVERTVTHRFVYDGWNVIAEETSDSSRPGVSDQRFFIWGLDIAESQSATGGVGALLAIVEKTAAGKTILLPVYDAQGNVIALVDQASGHQIASWQRGPFGEVLSETGETGRCPFGFATHYTDEESGLVYFGYRYYDPVTGRWLSREPLGEFESFNLYSYCHNDPVNKVDVLGLAERVIANSAPAFFVDTENPSLLLIGFPTENNTRKNGRKPRKYAPTGGYSIDPISRFSASMLGTGAYPFDVDAYRSTANRWLNSKRDHETLARWRPVRDGAFYVQQSSIVVLAFGEAYAASAAAPVTGGASSVFVVHAADTASTAAQRLLAGPENAHQIQSLTSQGLQQIGLTRSQAELGDAAVGILGGGASLYASNSSRLANGFLNSQFTLVNVAPVTGLSRGAQLRAKYGTIGPTELHQRINLRAAVSERLAGGGKGPVLSGVLDKQTGQIFFGLNGSVPANLHSTLASRLFSRSDDAWRAMYQETTGAGTHAEFRALNEALLARPGSSVSDFMIYNVWRRGSRRGLPIPRCPHCETLTEGAHFIPELLRFTPGYRF